jgi:hypothetical protein
MQFPPRIALVALVLMACEGPTGPMGNANVVTGTFTVDSLAWTNGFWRYPVSNGTAGQAARLFTRSVPAITTDIATNGAVLVYLRVPDGTLALVNWAPLPFHQSGLSPGYLVSWKYSFAAGKIDLAFMHESTNDVAPPPVADVVMPDHEFKYVAMSGVPAAMVARLTRETDPERVLAALRR